MGCFRRRAASHLQPPGVGERYRVLDPVDVEAQRALGSETASDPVQLHLAQIQAHAIVRAGQRGAFFVCPRDGRRRVQRGEPLLEGEQDFGQDNFTQHVRGRVG